MTRAALVCAFVVAAAGQAWAQPSAPIVVVPFANVGNEPRVHWLGEASAVLVADELRALGVSAIQRTDRVSAFEMLHLPPAAELSRATVIKVGQIVGASEVIVGTFRLDGEDLVVEARSIRVDVGRVKSPVTERGPLTDLFKIYERLAQRLAPGGRPVDAPRATAPPLGAFESFIKGLIAESPGAQATFLETAIEEFPPFDRARLALWDVRTEQGDYLAALTALKPVPSTSPWSRRARFASGISLLQLERYEDAYATFKALLDDAPARQPAAPSQTGAIYNNLGIVQLRRGATAESGTAAYFLTKATDADAADTDYLFNLGYAYVSDRNYQGGVYWLREALRRDPADADAHFVLAAALQATGSTVEAGRERELARQLSSRYEELERRATADRLPVPRGLERIRLELDGSRAQRADRVIVDTAQREQRELAAFHLERGRRLFAKEQDTEALAELRRAVYLSPYEAEAHLLIGRIYLRGGRPSEAIDALKISIWSEETADARVALARAYLNTGDKTSARVEAERALALDPASDAAKRILAEAR